MNEAFIFYCSLDKPLNDYHTQWALRNLSALENNTLSRFKQKIHHDLTLLGKLVLFHGLSDLGLENIDLKKMEYNQYRRPYLTDTSLHRQLDFNISHSGTLAAVAIVRDTTIGLDIEMKNLYKTSDYFSVFNDQEKHWINEDSVKFLRLWTRKEAVIKACGKGFYQNLTDVSVLNDSLMIENIRYYIKDFVLMDQYFGSIATAHLQVSLRLKELSLKDLT